MKGDFRENKEIAYNQMTVSKGGIYLYFATISIQISSSSGTLSKISKSR